MTMMAMFKSRRASTSLSSSAAATTALLFLLLSTNGAHASPSGAGSCNAGKVLSGVSAHGGSSGDNGSLSNGDLTLTLDGTVLQPSPSFNILSLTVGQFASLELERTGGGTFRGFRFRLSGDNGEDAGGSFVVANNNPPLSQLMVSGAPATCPDNVAGLTHTSTFSDRGESRTYVQNFLNPVASGTYTLDVTVVEINDGSQDVWYYDTYTLAVADAPVDETVAPSVEQSAVPTSMPSAVASNAPIAATNETTSMEPSDVPTLMPSSMPTDVPSATPSVMPSVTPSLKPSPSADQATEPPTRTPYTLRQCGDLIPSAAGGYIIPKDDILTVATTLVDTLFPPGSLANLIGKSFIEDMVTFSIRARVICTSCRDMEAYYQTKYGSSTLPAGGEDDGWESYCGADKFGANRTVSGLMLEPINESTGEVPVGILPGSIFHRLAETDPYATPSELWPEDITDILGHNPNDPVAVAASIASYYNVFGGMASATAGAVTVIPDGLGYGHDFGGTKSFLVKSAYRTGTMPLYLYAQRHMDETYNCTSMDGHVTLGGYSEGAYGAVSVSAALHRGLNVSVDSVNVGGGPYKTGSILPLTMVENINNGTYPPYYTPIMALLGYAYSSTNPDVSNTNAGQDLLSEASADDVKSWVEAGLTWEEMLGKIPIAMTDLFDEDFVSLMETASNSSDTDPCASAGNSTNKVCNALNENDLTSTLENAQYNIIFCHSPDDDLFDYANLPDIESSDFLQILTMPAGVLDAEGPHLNASSTCLFGTLLPFATGDGGKIEQIDDPLCYPERFPSASPSVAPTQSMAPTRSPITPPTSSAPSSVFISMLVVLVAPSSLWLTVSML